MKKLILVFCLPLLATVYVNAQTSQGNMMVGGGITFFTESQKNNSDYENKYFGFSPSFGYFVSDNLAVGASLSIENRTYDFGVSKTIDKDLGIGPFARYYKFTSNENFAFFGQAQLTYLSGSEDVTPGGVSKTSTIRFAIAPGFSYFINEHWAMELSIAGLVFESHDPNKDNDNDNQTRFQLSLSSLAPSLGLRYHFGN